MSQRRLPWSPTEKALLRRILAERPQASLSEHTMVFNNRNFRYRSEHAVKVMKRKQLWPQPNDSRDFLSSPQQRQPEEYLQNLADHSADYDWSSIETGIFIPLHPLIAEARRHSAFSLMPDYTVDASVATDWPLVLCTADISALNCSKEDKDALRNYLDCISCVHGPKRAPNREHVAGS
ncbi:hypothetical protein DL98DRAFT_536113 [Cadophora sp. DSE1049]|nr:hypothetical protein DL98DRAFT_536113 [Cadophora sp. DSE1049]